MIRCSIRNLKRQERHAPQIEFIIVTEYVMSSESSSRNLRISIVRTEQQLVWLSSPCTEAMSDLEYVAFSVRRPRDVIWAVRAIGASGRASDFTLVSQLIRNQEEKHL